MPYDRSQIWSWALLWYWTLQEDQLIVLAGHARRLALTMGPLLLQTAFSQWSLSWLSFRSMDLFYSGCRLWKIHCCILKWVPFKWIFWSRKDTISIFYSSYVLLTWKKKCCHYKAAKYWSNWLHICVTVWES